MSEIYLAPLEGVTGAIYRRCLHRHFGKGITKYFTPFIQPHIKRTMNYKEINEVLPDQNTGIYLVPQVLTIVSEDYLRFEKAMQDYGYREININLGCPSPTVTSKGRGAAFLSDPEQLDRFLYGIFEKCTARVSVKTRIGTVDTEEFPKLLEIYNKYPLHELIIHPRLKTEMYRGTPHHDAFAYALKNSSNPLVYNGDIFTVEDYKQLQAGAYWPETVTTAGRPYQLMLGRGIIRNPSLAGEIIGEPHFDSRTFTAFHDDLMEELAAAFSGDTPVLYKMKEYWTYMISSFPGHEKELKKILKCKTLSQYKALAWSIIQS